jgi:hypothetical protein
MERRSFVAPSRALRYSPLRSWLSTFSTRFCHRSTGTVASWALATGKASRRRASARTGVHLDPVFLRASRREEARESGLHGRISLLVADE